MCTLDEPHQRHLRRLVLSCILATDMGLHAEIISHFLARLNDPRPFQLSSPYTPPGPTLPEASKSNNGGTMLSCNQRFSSLNYCTKSQILKF